MSKSKTIDIQNTYKIIHKGKYHLTIKINNNNNWFSIELEMCAF